MPLTPSPAAALPCAVDTMVLAMFVDAGCAELLAALAGGRVFVSPSILDPEEQPPFAQQPLAEFARGLYAGQRHLADPLYAERVQRRTAFYQAVRDQWEPVLLSGAELQYAHYLTSPAARAAAKLVEPTLKVKRVSRGEAETAAVAIARGWALWSDDAAIVALVRALHPGHPIERLCGLLVRAVRTSLIPCLEAAQLYNEIFKRRFGLWTTLSLQCHEDIPLCR